MKQAINIIGVIGIIIFIADQLLHNIALYGDMPYKIIMVIGVIMFLPLAVRMFIQSRKEKNGEMKKTDD